MLKLELDDPRWGRFVASRPEANPFHHPSWARALAACYGYRAFALALPGEDGELTAGLPLLDVRGLLGRRRWVSLPFTDECAPLAASGDAARALASALEEARRADDVPRVEVRAELDAPEAGTATVGFVHVLELQPDADAVFRGFKRKQVQQPIEKTEREGHVLVRRAGSREDLTAVFYGLHLRTRRRLGTPVQPRRYFERLWDDLIAPGHGFVLVAEAGGTPIASAVFLAWNGTILYKYSASRQDALKLRPNNMLLWNAIRWGCENGYRALDFGRTDLGNEGLRAFKRGWGGEERPLVYSALGGPAPEPGSGRAEQALSAVIRHSPPWVCRGLGELLYKYAA